jgi:hypothetical protein
MKTPGRSTVKSYAPVASRKRWQRSIILQRHDEDEASGCSSARHLHAFLVARAFVPHCVVTALAELLAFDSQEQRNV